MKPGCCCSGNHGEGPGAPAPGGTCLLCGMPLSEERKSLPDKRGQFCCDRCFQVHQVAESSPPGVREKILAKGKGGERGENAEKARAFPGVPPEATAREVFSVEGLSCPSCARLVDALLLRREGVLDVETDFLSDSVRVAYDMRRVSPDDLERALSEAGYKLSRLRGEKDPETRAFSRLLWRFLIAFFLGLNLMMLSAVHYASALEWIPETDLRSIAFLQLFLAVPLLFLDVLPLAARSLRLLRMGKPSMDLLFVMGFSAAFFLSIAAFFTEKGHFYFDACGAFVTISLFGRLVEGRLRFRAARELKALIRLPASKAAVLGERGNKVYRRLEDLEPGDRIFVEPGVYVPCDCENLEGARLVSEAMLTGESTPVLKKPGETVWAGSTVLETPLTGKVLRPFKEGRLQKIAAGVAQALAGNELRLRSADRLAAWFVPLVICLAALTLAARLLFLPHTGILDPAAWLPSISVLLVACPCAFGIATASAVAVAVSTLLEKGILVKDGGALERFCRSDTLTLDKTGTLTTGTWKVRDIEWAGGKPDSGTLEAVAGTEEGVEHPVAQTLFGHLVRERGLSPRKPCRADRIPGRGVKASFGKDTLAVGSPALFEEIPPMEDPGEETTVVYFGWNGKAAGRFLLKDTPRPEAASVAAFFAGEGLEVQVLSGDREEVARSTARKLGIPKSKGGLLPEEKKEVIAALRARGKKVAFAGDGSNDGPALAESDVGIALRHGTDLSLETAHFIPLSGDLSALPPLYRASRLTLRTIRRNFGWALLYNTLFLPAAALGYLHPIAAAGLMLASSSTVLLHSLFLRGWIRKAW